MSNSRQGDGRGPGKQILDASNRYNIGIFQGPGGWAGNDEGETFLRLCSGYRRLTRSLRMISDYCE